MRELIDKIKGVGDLTEKYGEQVIARAGIKAHYGNVVGVFWYDLLSGGLDYIAGGVTAHNAFKNYKDYVNKNGMVRGRLIEDVGKVYIFLYTGDFENHRVSGAVVNDIFYKVSNETDKVINYVVDELGRDLVERNVV